MAIPIGVGKVISTEKNEIGLFVSIYDGRFKLEDVFLFPGISRKIICVVGTFVKSMTSTKIF